MNKSKDKDRFEFDREHIFSFQLTDERELREQQIDELLKWIAENNPDSVLQNRAMVEAATAIAYYQQRRSELQQQRHDIAQARMMQCDREVQDIQQHPPAANAFVPEHQVQARQQQAIAQKIAEKEKERDFDLKTIVGRFNSLLQQCDEEIAGARQRYEAAGNSTAPKPS
ncbi:MAG: hypothetical protein KME17_08465 [Cyanosarcina radialis HA8281-LM2]|jgi:hemoglobin-like flavoprotein|nr:hypothetical protein [Cyanosarcina radialis HA8281-LM2]